jgi:transposase
MENVGIDLGKNQSQICILATGGELIEKRIRTECDRFKAVLGERPKARILIEASTESEWVARCVEAMGHEVIVADPNYAPMYSERSRRIKTDRRDARALAEACRLGAYRPAHRSSDEQHHVRGQLAVREALVRTRTRYISLVRALLRREGVRIRTGYAESFMARVGEIELSPALQEEIEPLRIVMVTLNEQIDEADKTILEIVKSDQSIRRLCQVPGVGPITATSFVATIGSAQRFRGAHQLEAYLGLVPREYSSGEKQRKGGITKAGNGRTRWLLVEAAWGILLRSRRPETAVLRTWAEKVAGRRGKSIAVVALARRLAGILYAMMRDGTEYTPTRLGGIDNRVPEPTNLVERS